METDPTETERFASLAEARAAYCELENESQSLLDEAGAKLSAMETDLNLANERANRAEAETALHQATLASLQVTNAEQAAKIAELEANTRTAEAEAARIAASVGVEPVSVAAQSSGGTITEQYRSIKDPVERARFFQAHKQELIADAKQSA